MLFGVALVENEEHRTAALRVALPKDIEAVDRDLLGLARLHLPGIPVDDIDLLIVDEMGKDISGNGLDPNVVGKAAPVVFRAALATARVAHLRARPHRGHRGQRLRARRDRRHHDEASGKDRREGDSGERVHVVRAGGREDACGVRLRSRRHRESADDDPADDRGRPAPGPHPQHDGPRASVGVGRLPRAAARSAGRDPWTRRRGSWSSTPAATWCRPLRARRRAPVGPGQRGRHHARPRDSTLAGSTRGLSFGVSASSASRGSSATRTPTSPPRWPQRRWPTWPASPCGGSTTSRRMSARSSSRRSTAPAAPSALRRLLRAVVVVDPLAADRRRLPRGTR